MKKQLLSPKKCDNFLTLGVGLMFSRKQEAVLIFKRKRKIGLHGLFVFFPLHIYLLDEDKRIVEIGFLNSFGYWKGKKEAKYVVESPNDLKLSLRDEIDW